MIITHYFPSSIQNKFAHSITEYDSQQQFEIAKKLAQCDGRALRRFDKFEEYISRRVKTEEWLYKMFLEINGIPKTKNPFYFVLGEHDDLRHDFGSESSYFQLDTDQILDSYLSFTIGDSMSVLFSDAPKRIYSMSQIKEIVNDTTFIDRQFEHIIPNHRYIEAQLWDKRYLQGYDNLELSTISFSNQCLKPIKWYIFTNDIHNYIISQSILIVKMFFARCRNLSQSVFLLAHLTKRTGLFCSKSPTSSEYPKIKGIIYESTPMNNHVPPLLFDKNAPLI